MTTTGSPVPHAPDCTRFEAQLGAWLEHDLEAGEQDWMTAHRHHCDACARLVADLEAVIADASALPPLTPPRDLWQDIEARLEARVIPLRPASPVAESMMDMPGEPSGAAASPGVSSGTATSPATPRHQPLHQPPRDRSQRTVTVRWFAIAATLLVAVSSVVTWQIAQRGITGAALPRDTTGTVATRDVPPAGGVPATGVSAGASPIADSAVLVEVPRSIGAPPAATHLAAGSPLPIGARRPAATRVVNDDADLLDVDVTYEREISALRHIVDERFSELDSSTVSVLRRNLEIIDQAITDSRAALARDPRSAVVSSQLDRALQAKLSLMRRVALL